MSIPRNPLPNIDLIQHANKCFANCIDSFMALETTSMMEQGASVMTSRVSMERFVYNLGIMAGLVGHDGYDPGMTKEKAFPFWAGLVKKLKDDGYIKGPSTAAHL